MKLDLRRPEAPSKDNHHPTSLENGTDEAASFRKTMRPYRLKGISQEGIQLSTPCATPMDLEYFKLYLSIIVFLYAVFMDRKKGR
ncbi:MAG: hypothetical protein EOP84_20265 [Verrucomicrobiaceae bacterium]|nr:MAG: hypothetical protein EOP84_20265 [Verrucomicrobiaceae bacterium]